MQSNPYYGDTFFSFFTTLAQRVFTPPEGTGLAPDEIQLLVLVLVSTSAALVGTFLHLRNMAMLANSLSHTILLGICIVFLFVRGTSEGSPISGFSIGSMMAAAFISGALTTFITDFVRTTLRLQADASTGLVFTSLFALGIILVTLFARNAHIGTEAVMGSVDALVENDIYLVGMVLLVNCLVISLFFKEFQITAFDAKLSFSLGISNALFGYLIMFLVSLTCVSAFRAVGVLMVLAFFVGPPLTARLLTHRLKWMVLYAIGFGALASICGVALSRHLLSVNGVALSTGGVVVTLISLQFLIVAIFKARGVSIR